MISKTAAADIARLRQALARLTAFQACVTKQGRRRPDDLRHWRELVRDADALLAEIDAREAAVDRWISNRERT